MTNSNTSIALLTIILISSFTAGYLFPTNTEKKYKFEVETMPDFRQYENVQKKKQDFFNFLLPRVKVANENILEERRWLLELDLSNLSDDQEQRLNELAEKYEVDDYENSEQLFTVLKRRIDVLPPSMVLAQAANESAWGTSRFARKGNNLFGQWCYVEGCGLIPKNRNDNGRHEVAKFDDVQESIESYMRNLNSQFSYKDLRIQRSNMRKNNEKISGYKLAAGLIKYSTRREEYIKEIRAMIKQNRLGQYD
ncbi:hypothetical protein HF888_11645 [Bermanella marisrubri]|uniref:Predicted peptidoglycan hydrolase, FlgJ family protein n=1 Tax=Bermanella marisrubri TaxID=207949 RepID=Q1N2Q5_9GAMM|nr:glucosaminidase domain-containing protein [Bermanella marisrubri]EAT12614.1 Predicted peptidoglycan hydrolase, FlgJ family protein [Oceanobacter sp. RED65] [Bermanella marisrubri]QIZ84834.1 hypothetical protein HF888_11645 [Bermanella marisrubri]